MDISRPTETSVGAAQQVTRKNLYEPVWREPMLRVAERHGVSSIFLAGVGEPDALGALLAWKSPDER
jgi:hypothetical protein